MKKCKTKKRDTEYTQDEEDTEKTIKKILFFSVPP
jgi:hypothetical protein